MYLRAENEGSLEYNVTLPVRPTENVWGCVCGWGRREPKLLCSEFWILIPVTVSRLMIALVIRSWNLEVHQQVILVTSWILKRPCRNWCHWKLKSWILKTQLECRLAEDLKAIWPQGTLTIVNTDRRTTERSTSDSPGDVSWIQKAALQLYRRNVPLLHTSRFYQAFPRVSTASGKRWGEKAWVRG